VHCTKFDFGWGFAPADLIRALLLGEGREGEHRVGDGKGLYSAPNISHRAALLHCSIKLIDNRHCFVQISYFMWSSLRYLRT